MIPLAPFEPDRAKYAPGTAPVVTNAIPVADGWAPIPDLAYVTGSLGAECRGMVRVRTPAGVVRSFAGTATALKEWNSGTSLWDTVSGPSAPYAVPTNDEWSFAVFGDYLVATALGKVPQYIGITSGTAFADLPGSPPQAKYVWTAGEYLFLGNISSAPSKIQCSGLGDAGYWTVGQRGSSDQEFPDGGEVMGGIGSQSGAILFQREKIRQITFVNSSDYSFRADIINPNRGAVAPLSICQLGPGQFFYYSTDGFMLGVEGNPIGAERVDKWFRSFAGHETVPQIKSAVDPVNKIVWTAYQQGVTVLIGYNWQLDRWCYATMGISRMGVMAMPTLSWDTGGTILMDDDTEAFDANPGNQDQFAAFDSSNRLCFFSGSNREATMETADTELVPGQRAWLQEVQTVGECSSYTVQVGTVDKLGDDPSFTTASTPHSDTGIAHFRSPGRWHRVRLNIPYGADWNVISGVEPLFKAEGRR